MERLGWMRYDEMTEPILAEENKLQEGLLPCSPAHAEGS